MVRKFLCPNCHKLVSVHDNRAMTSYKFCPFCQEPLSEEGEVFPCERCGLLITADAFGDLKGYRTSNGTICRDCVHDMTTEELMKTLCAKYGDSVTKEARINPLLRAAFTDSDIEAILFRELHSLVEDGQILMDDVKEEAIKKYGECGELGEGEEDLASDILALHAEGEIDLFDMPVTLGRNIND